MSDRLERFQGRSKWGNRCTIIGRRNKPNSATALPAWPTESGDSLTMNTGDVVPELDVDRVQANDELRQASARFDLILKRQLSFRHDLINLRPTPIPHFGLDALP